MTPLAPDPPPHRWYARPVFFVDDIGRAASFYVDRLGFHKAWHTEEGTGTVCQVTRDECEIILCADPERRDRTRLFVELTAEGLAAWRLECTARAVPFTQVRWGYDTLRIEDPDGNELYFPTP